MPPEVQPNAKAKAKGAAAKAKAKGAAKAKRSYRPRLLGQQVTPPAVLAKTARMQAAMRARGGCSFLCPVCTYPRFIPIDANQKTVYSCAMPRVRVGDRSTIKCSFATTVDAWRSRTPTTRSYEIACETVVHDVVRDLDARCDAGEIPHEDFWPRLRRDLPDHSAQQERASQPSAAAPG